MADPALPRQVAEAAAVTTVNAARRTPTHRAGRRSGADVHGYNNAIVGDGDVINDETGREQGQQRFGQGNQSTQERDSVPSMCSLSPVSALTLHRKCGRTSSGCRLTLADVLARINDLPQTKLHELLPWEWKRLHETTSVT